MTPGFAKTRAELPWLPYGKVDRVVINAHNFPPPVSPIPHASKHLAVWLAEAAYLTLSGTTVLAWTDTISGRVMTTTSGAPTWNGSDVLVNTDAIQTTFADRVQNTRRAFCKCTPHTGQTGLDTRLWSEATTSLRLHDSTSYRSLDTAQNSEDWSFSTGRVWVNKVRTSTFSGRHVVSAESTGSRTFTGLKSHFGTRHPRTRYEAIILTSAVTDAEGDDITDWLMAYKP
jgi:hypothetical protein